MLFALRWLEHQGQHFIKQTDKELYLLPGKVEMKQAGGGERRPRGKPSEGLQAQGLPPQGLPSLAPPMVSCWASEQQQEPGHGRPGSCRSHLEASVGFATA